MQRKDNKMSEKHIGKVTQVIGPVIDVRFPEGELPALLNAVRLTVGDRQPDFRAGRGQDARTYLQRPRGAGG